MIGWLQCASGVSGDMMLGALVDAGVQLVDLQGAVDAVVPDQVTLRAERVVRGTLAATKIHVDGTDSLSHRTWREVRALIEAALFPGKQAALQTFAALAAAESKVHGMTPDEVHFHEVGALDAIADVVASCAGVEQLGLEHLAVSAVAVGGGTAHASHGQMPVPVPAVVELLRGWPTVGGPAETELTTPTGAALIRVLGEPVAMQPPMFVHAQGFGAGSRDFATHPNVTRLLLGDAADLCSGMAESSTELVLETNVDDLDPRIWPDVLDELLEIGAADAWLSPVLMKKGRPAHQLSVLVAADRAARAQEVIFTKTSAIGLRSHPVGKLALARESTTVRVDGECIGIKVARGEDRVLNAQPEWEEVRAAAVRTGMPAKELLARAVTAFWVDQP